MGPSDTDTHGGHGERATYEAAQRRLFAASGLEPREQFIDLGPAGGRTHVIELGPSDVDHPVVLVHGTALAGGLFAPLMGALEAVPVVTFDRPGYGLSAPFRYTEGTVGPTAVTNLLGVLDALGIDRADIVGHSMGGHVGIRFALAHPDRVRQLTLMGAAPGLPGTSPPLPIRLLTTPVFGRLLRWRQPDGEAGVLDIAEVFGERDAIQSHPAFIAALAAHEAVPTAAAAGISEFKAVLSIRGWRRSVHIAPETLRTLPVPTTFIWGDQDPLGGPGAVRDVVGSADRVRVETVRAGHLPFLATADRCAHLIRAGRRADG